MAIFKNKYQKKFIIYIVLIVFLLGFSFLIFFGGLFRSDADFDLGEDLLFESGEDDPLLATSDRSFQQQLEDVLDRLIKFGNWPVEPGDNGRSNPFLRSF